MGQRLEIGTYTHTHKHTQGYINILYLSGKLKIPVKYHYPSEELMFLNKQ